MVSKKFSFRPVGESNSAGKAITFASSTSQGFCVAVDVLVAVTNITKPLSVKLRGDSQIFFLAKEEFVEGARNCLTVLNEMRSRESVNKENF